MVFNYTDLELTLTVDAEYLSRAEGVYVSVETDAAALKLPVSSGDIDTETGEIRVILTQEMTGQLLGKALVQVNGFINGRRWASEQGTIMFRRNLLMEVIKP